MVRNRYKYKIVHLLIPVNICIQILCYRGFIALTFFNILAYIIIDILANWFSKSMLNYLLAALVCVASINLQTAIIIFM